jgi:ABC-2 type transport system permease protein
LAAGIFVGAAAAGENATAAGAGVLVAGMYGAAMAGIGMAVGGLGWPRLAGAATGGVAGAFFLLDLLGPALKLPDWLVDLAPARHLGQPMAGVYDGVGIGVVAGIALVGYALGAWGFSRRDLRS